MDPVSTAMPENGLIPDRLPADAAAMALLAVSMVVSAVLATVGSRVLIRARAAGANTDALIGVYFLALGIGAIPALLSNNPQLIDRESARYAMALGHAALSVGFGALLIFVWRCFGVRSPWRMAAALIGCAALCLLFLGQGVVERFEPPGGDIVRATAVVRGSAVAWAFGESLRYWLLMRRRVELGLADPVVANRFMLWCLWMGGMTSATAIAIGVRFFIPEYGPEGSMALRTAVVVPIVSFTILAAVSLWLAFFPPSWYERRVRATGPELAH